jgi:hypothetical protein
MTTIIDTLSDYFFYLEHTRKVTDGTLLTYRQTLKDFCNLYGKKDTKELLPTHIIRFKNHLSVRPCIRKVQKGMSS